MFFKPKIGIFLFEREKEMKKKLLTLGLALLLVSCGFRPLYGQKDQLLADTQTVQIEPIVGEGGYSFYMILKDKLNPQGQPTHPRYRLTVQLNAPAYQNQSIRSDNFATLESMKMTADYQLTRISDGKKVISTSVNGNGLFNLIREPYATTVAQDKLYENITALMADDIATHILAYFKGIER